MRMNKHQENCMPPGGINMVSGYFAGKSSVDEESL